MALSEALSEFSFRLLGPGATRGADGHFHIARDDGSVTTLIETGSCPLEAAVVDFGPHDSRLKARLRSLLRIRKMSRLSNAAVLNLAVSEMSEGDAFVNVGVWHGFTLLAAMAGNDERTCVGVDNFSEFGGPRDQFLERFHERRSRAHRFHDQDYEDFFAAGLAEPLGVYLYDGEHSFENQYRGLLVADPFYADDAVVIVDDTNLDRARDATLKFASDSRLDWSVVFDRRTAGRKHPTLWNGLMILQAGPAAARVDWDTVASVEERLVPEGSGGSGRVTVLALGGAEVPALAGEGHEVVPSASSAELADALLTSAGDYVLVAEGDADPSPKAVARAVAVANRDARKVASA